jgi:hypothetical protein
MSETETHIFFNIHQACNTHPKYIYIYIFFLLQTHCNCKAKNTALRDTYIYRYVRTHIHVYTLTAAIQTALAADTHIYLHNSMPQIYVVLLVSLQPTARTSHTAPGGIQIKPTPCTATGERSTEGGQPRARQRNHAYVHGYCKKCPIHIRDGAPPETEERRYRPHPCIAPAWHAPDA